MRPLVAAAVAALLFGSFLPSDFAHGQSVEGRVIDADESPISGASISFRRESRRLVARAASDENGLFRVGPIDPGDYFVVVERLGYGTTESILSLRDGDSISVEFHLAVEAIPLEPITVTASARPQWEHLQPPALWEFWERKDHMERLGLGHFFTYEDIQPFGGQKAALTITDLAPFFFAESHRERVTSFIIRGRGLDRGGGPCYPPVFLDGHLLTGPSRLGGDLLEKEPPIIDDWIHQSQIAGLEIYRGASDVPAEYRVPGSNCGVVAVWSLRGPKR